MVNFNIFVDTTKMEQKKIKEFKKLGITKYFLRDFEKIQSAFRLSSSLHSELKDTRACGDEVEIAVRNFFKEHLFPKYHICDGHIIDKNLGNYIQSYSKNQ